METKEQIIRDSLPVPVTDELEFDKFTRLLLASHHLKSQDQAELYVCWQRLVQSRLTATTTETTPNRITEAEKAASTLDLINQFVQSLYEKLVAAKQRGTEDTELAAFVTQLLPSIGTLIARLNNEIAFEMKQNLSKEFFDLVANAFSIRIENESLTFLDMLQADKSAVGFNPIHEVNAWIDTDMSSCCNDPEKRNFALAARNRAMLSTSLSFADRNILAEPLQRLSAVINAWQTESIAATAQPRFKLHKKEMIWKIDKILEVLRKGRINRR